MRVKERESGSLQTARVIFKPKYLGFNLDTGAFSRRISSWLDDKLS